MSFKNVIAPMIKRCDFFGESFTFKIKKRKYYTSIVGGLTSLAFIIYSVYYIIVSLSDFIGKNNRNVQNQIKSIKESSIDFKNHDYFFMAVCLRDSSMAVDSRLSKNMNMGGFLIDNKLKDKRLNSTTIALKMDSCNKEYFKGGLSEIYDSKEFNGCMCINMKQQDAKLRSKYNVVDKEYVRVDLKYNKGVSLTEMNSYLNTAKSKLFVYLPSYTIDAGNLIDPLKMNIHTEVYDLKPNTIHSSEILFNLLNFTDFNSIYDDGTILFYLKI
jgi:hypothetical protein